MQIVENKIKLISKYNYILWFFFFFFSKCHHPLFPTTLQPILFIVIYIFFTFQMVNYILEFCLQKTKQKLNTNFNELSPPTVKNKTFYLLLKAITIFTYIFPDFMSIVLLSLSPLSFSPLVSFVTTRGQHGTSPWVSRMTRYKQRTVIVSRPSFFTIPQIIIVMNAPWRITTINLIVIYSYWLNKWIVTYWITG